MGRLSGHRVDRCGGQGCADLAQRPRPAQTLQGAGLDRRGVSFVAGARRWGDLRARRARALVVSSVAASRHAGARQGAHAADLRRLRPAVCRRTRPARTAARRTESETRSADRSQPRRAVFQTHRRPGQGVFRARATRAARGHHREAPRFALPHGALARMVQDQGQARGRIRHRRLDRPQGQPLASSARCCSAITTAASSCSPVKSAPDSTTKRLREIGAELRKRERKTSPLRGLTAHEARTRTSSNPNSSRRSPSRSGRATGSCVNRCSSVCAPTKKRPR